jgi:hypothetical protein
MDDRIVPTRAVEGIKKKSKAKKITTFTLLHNTPRPGRQKTKQKQENEMLLPNCAS